MLSRLNVVMRIVQGLCEQRLLDDLVIIALNDVLVHRNGKRSSSLEAETRLDPIKFEVSFYSTDGVKLYATLESIETVDLPEGIVEFEIPLLSLQPGTYYVGAAARDARSSHVIGEWDGGSVLHVESSGRNTAGQVFIPHTTRVLDVSAGAAGSARFRRG